MGCASARSVLPGADVGPCRHAYCEKWGDRYHCVDCGSFVTDQSLIELEESRIKAIVDNSSRQDAINRGVTIGFLLDFAQKHNCFDLTTRDVRRHIIMPATFFSRCRYVELPEMKQHTGKAVTFVSHAWDAKFGDLVAAVCDGNADRNRVVWVDIFAVRQWPSQKPDLDVGLVVKQCKSFLIVCSTSLQTKQPSSEITIVRGASFSHAPVYGGIAFLRLWCLVEIYEAIACGLPIILKGGGHTHVKEQLVFQTNERMIEKLVELIDLETAEASVDEDKERLLGSLRSRSVDLETANASICKVINGARGAMRHAIVHCAVCGDDDARDLLRNDPSGYIAAVASCGYVKLMQRLIDMGADYNLHNAQGMTPLTSASYGGHEKCVAVLIKLGCDINRSAKMGFTPLMLSCCGGFDACVQLLIEAGCDVNFSNQKGYTGLLCAAQGGHVECMQLLLDNKARVDARSAEGHTPLMLAAKNGHTNSVELLVKYKADVNAQNKDGSTALMLAAQSGHTHCVETLIVLRADMNLQTTTTRMTALMCAVLQNRLECVQLLADKGCDTGLLNVNGKTALDLARESGNRRCATAIEQLTELTLFNIE